MVNKMKHSNSQKRNKFISVMLLSMFMVFCSGLYMNSFAVSPTSTKVTIDGVKYSRIKSTDTVLYSGTYALGSDVVLNDSLDVSYIDDDANPTPITIILNNYSLSIKDGSQKPVIKVYNGATLILKDKAGNDGKVVASYTAVSVDGGNLILENADILSDSYAVDAVNANVTISGNSVIAANENAESGCGTINCGDAVYLTLKNNTKTQILCKDNQRLNLEETGSDMRVLVKVRSADDQICDARIVLPETYKGYKHFFTDGSSDTSVIISSQAGNNALVQSINCTGHKYTYTKEGLIIKAICSECGLESSISLVNNTYYDASTNTNYADEISKEIYIDDNNWDAYKVNVFPTVVFKNENSGEYGFDIPENPGNYTAKLVLLEEENNLNSVLADTDELQFTKQCSQHVWEYVVDDNSISAKCKTCGGTFAVATLSANCSETPDTTGPWTCQCGNICTGNFCNNCGTKRPEPIINLYACQGDKFEYNLSVSGMNMGLGNFAVLYGYYQNNGSIKYTLTEPTEQGNYFIKLAVLKYATRPSSAIVSTNAIAYSYKYHDWHYEADEDSINACCHQCNECASVCLDSSEIVYASRQYANTGSGSFNGNVFIENGWSSAKGITPYHVLYRNYDEADFSASREPLKKDNINCFAKIVLLSDEEDIDSINLSTNEKQFYYSTISVADSNISFQSFDESRMKEPSSQPCYKTHYAWSTREYFVGTVEELYWVLKYGGPIAYINLTNDIIVNPVVISDDGKTMYSASNIIYTWPGFGTILDEYKGGIEGNGYTIYGLYSIKDDNDNSGFIAYGINTDVSNLNISDSWFVGRFVGGISAMIHTYQNEYCEINNCSVSHCYFQGNSAGNGTAGSLIGFASINEAPSGYTMSNCTASNNYISAYLSGGIVGRAECSFSSTYVYNETYDHFHFDFYHCVNLCEVNGIDAAGGILGRTWSNWPLTVSFSNCRNLGRIDSTLAAGGIIGAAYNNEKDFTGLSVDLYNNTSIGDVFCDRGCAGGLVGICESYTAGLAGVNHIKRVYPHNDSFFGASYAVGANYYPKYTGAEDHLMITDGSSWGRKDVIDGVIRLTSAVARSANMCDSYNHILGEWEITQREDCTHNGTRVQKCIVCGQTISTETIYAHGHDYVDGKCVYCEESNPNQTGSVFSNTYNVIYLLAGVLIIAAGSIIVVRLKKRNQ